MKRKIVAVLLFLSWSVALAEDQMQIGFRGLPWGASEGQVRARYGKEMKREKCGTTLARAKAYIHQACDNPVIDPYEVAGIPFKLSFELSKETRALVEVSLYFSMKVEPHSESPAVVDWRAKNDLLHAALIKRFGDFGTHNVLEKDGLFLLNESWHTSDTKIELQSVLHNEYADDVREDFQLTYKPLSGDVESRL